METLIEISIFPPFTLHNFICVSAGTPRIIKLQFVPNGKFLSVPKFRHIIVLLIPYILGHFQSRLVFLKFQQTDSGI